MKTATFNVNGRVQVLPRWFYEINFLCVQELKRPDDGFPIFLLSRRPATARFGWAEKPERRGEPGTWHQPVETPHGIPVDAVDIHSRYIEEAIRSILIGCGYLPNDIQHAVPSSMMSCAGSRTAPSMQA